AKLFIVTASGRAVSGSTSASNPHGHEADATAQTKPASHADATTAAVHPAVAAFDLGVERRGRAAFAGESAAREGRRRGGARPAAGLPRAGDPYVDREGRGRDRRARGGALRSPDRRRRRLGFLDELDR